MGDRVDFECIEDHKIGRPQAIRVRRNNDPYDDSADSATKMKKSINDLDSTRLKGKCVKWNAQKGFGFIKKDDFNVFLQNGDDNIFVHFSDILNGDALNEGDRVEFQMGTRNNSRK